MTRYRFLDPMGDVVSDDDFPDRETAFAAAEDFEEAEVFRVEYQGPEGDWRWAGALNT
jgi:hypothetical protein